MINFNDFVAGPFPAQDDEEFRFDVQSFLSDHSAKIGPRIMFLQLRGCFLPSISVTLLKDPYRSFVSLIHFVKLIVAAFRPALQDISAKFIPLEFANREDPFLSLGGNKDLFGRYFI